MMITALAASGLNNGGCLTLFGGGFQDFGYIIISTVSLIISPETSHFRQSLGMWFTCCFLSGYCHLIIRPVAAQKTLLYLMVVVPTER